MEVEKNKPVYSTNVAADLSGISKSTLMRYEEKGLINPYKSKGGKRLYSHNDIEWLICLKDLIKKGYSILSLKKLLKYESCYELKNCSEEIKAKCQIIKDQLKNQG
ncbi:MAG: MerR family transcriptional regulator [bacterium]